MSSEGEQAMGILAKAQAVATVITMVIVRTVGGT